MGIRRAFRRFYVEVVECDEIVLDPSLHVVSKIKFVYVLVGTVFVTKRRRRPRTTIMTICRNLRRTIKDTYCKVSSIKFIENLILNIGKGYLFLS